MRIYLHKSRPFIRRLIDQKLGDTCFICGGRVNLAAHRIDGKRHTKLLSLSLKTVQKQLDSGLYVRLCYACHKATHWCMTRLGFTWEKIVDLYWLHGAARSARCPVTAQVEGSNPSGAAISE